MKRYYTPSLDRGLLDAEQSHHCAQVMRQGVGDLFAVFDYHLAKGPRSFDSAQPNAKANVSSPFALLRMTDLGREAFAEVSSCPGHRVCGALLLKYPRQGRC